MPRGDGTGPEGLGPMTGRGAGYCAGFPVPGYRNPVGYWGGGFRRWPGRWLGFGRGWRRMYYATGLPGWARFGYPGWATPVDWPRVAPFYLTPPYWVPYTARDPKDAAKAVAEQEVAFLKERAEFLKEELKGIEERLRELDTSEKGKTEEDK